MSARKRRRFVRDAGAFLGLDRAANGGLANARTETLPLIQIVNVADKENELVPLNEGGARRRTGEGPRQAAAPGAEANGATPLGPRWRWDQPTEIVGKRRGSAAAVAQILACPRLRENARADFCEASLALTTRPVYESRDRTLDKFARLGGFESMWPLQPEKIEVVFGAMRAAGYTALPYLEYARRAHKRRKHQWTQEMQVACEDARLAVKRGMGPTSKAGLFSLESLKNALGVMEPVVLGGPRRAGKAAAVATWFLLREVECMLLTVKKVSFPAPGLARLDLGPTKADPGGAGKARAHSCICDLGGDATALCPFHLLRGIVDERGLEGAGLDDLLFPTVDGGAADKKAVVDSWHLLLDAVDGEVNGHSPRRTGAQLFTEKGVPPWETEWFGRWGSSAMKAYIEDARARSRDGAGIARKIFAAASSIDGPEGKAPVYSGRGGELGLAGPTPDSGGGNGTVALEGKAPSSGNGGGVVALGGAAPAPDYRTMIDIQEEIGRAAAAAAAGRNALDPEQILRIVQGMLIHFRKDLVQEVLAIRDEDGMNAVLVSNLRSGKVHAARARDLLAPPRTWEALCGWKFGLGDGRAAHRDAAPPASRNAACFRCWRKGRKLQLLEPKAQWDWGFDEAASAESTESDSASSCSDS
jgi:hypothetical protein